MARVLLLGDSITVGIGSTTIDPTYKDACSVGLRYGFRKRMADGTPQHEYVGPCGRAPYKHAGVGGSRTSDWLPDGAYGKQVPGWIRAHAPTWVHLLIGTNDAIASVDPGVAARNVAASIASWSATNPSVTFTAGTIPYFRGAQNSALNRWVDAYANALKATIADLDLPNAHVVEAMASYDVALLAAEAVTDDGTHPNDAGYVLVGNGMAIAFGGAPDAVVGTKVDVPPSSGLVGPMAWETGPRLETITRERGGAGEPEVLVYAPNDARTFLANVVGPWRPTVLRACTKAGIPWAVPYALAIANAESGGDPRAFRREPPSDAYPGGLTGVGLFQLTDPGIKKGYTDEQLFDPDLNADLGAKAIAYQTKRYGRDLVRIASAYNCGSAYSSPGTLWGLCAASQKYLTTIVLASNTFILRGANVPTGVRSGDNSIVATLAAVAGVTAIVVVPWRKILSGE